MVFAGRKKFIVNVDIFLNDEIIEREPINFLGVLLDEKLSWCSHIDRLCKIMSKFIGVLNRVKHNLSVSAMLLVYNGLILPHLSYGAVAWGAATQTRIDKILIKQKHIIRLMLNKTRFEHSHPLFEHLGLLNIHCLIKFETL